MHKWKYIVVLPVVVWLILFCYKPMYGVIIAFLDFDARKGIDASPWVGIYHFLRFFKDPFFWRVIRNTLRISSLSILFSFPVPIMLALMLNEIRVSWFKRTLQTVTYMPHFISTVVVCSILHTLFGANGLIPEALKASSVETILSIVHRFWYLGRGGLELHYLFGSPIRHQSGTL